MRRSLWVCVGLGCGRAPATLWVGGDVFVDAATGDRLGALPGPGVANLECGIGDATATGGGADWTLVCDPAAPGWLADQGVVGVGWANNHAADGAVAPDIAHSQGTPVLLDGGWWLLAVHADREDWAPTATPPGHPAIALVHASDRAGYLPSPQTAAGVETLVDAGWDVVALSGSHRVGAVERRGGTFIAWGLGNLLFDCPCSREDEALVLALRRPRWGALQVEVVPVRAGLDGGAVRAHEDPGGVMALVEGLN